MRLRRCHITTALISMAVLVSSALASCQAAERTTSPTTTVRGSTFAIVLADSGEVLLTESDVQSYYSDNHTLTLKESGIRKWNSHLTYQDIPKLAESLFQREFIIQAEGKEICRGRFWSNLSSASITGVVILESLFKLDADRNSISIESGYPAGGPLDPSVSSAIDRALRRR